MIGRRPIDLHLHTTASDGVLSPAELVELARRSRLSAIAVTDHDTVAGVDEAFQAGSAAGLEVVPGVEISVDHPVGSMHMLGLFIDHRDASFRHWLEDLCRSRLRRYPLIVKKLQSLGVEITVGEVEAEAGESVIGRPHIARVLVATGAVRDMEEAFRRYLGEEGAAYVPRERVDSSLAISRIHQAGGLAVLAHYTTCCPGEGKPAVRALLERLCSQGLDGLETFYHSFTPDEHYQAVELAHRFDLLEAGGSDFHGPLRPGFLLGRRLAVPRRVLNELKRGLRRREAGA